MSHAIVTLELTSKQRIDLALPLNIPNQVLGPAVAKALEMTDGDSDSYLLSVKTENGIVRLSAETTLSEAGVLDGFVLQLQRKAKKNVEPVSKPDENIHVSLQAENGGTFPLNAEVVSIGRRDVKRGVLVDIDLTPLDSGKIISRRHATIEQQGGKFILKDLDSINGTWVNNERIDPHQPHTLQNGDLITFGKNGVQVRFQKE